MDAADLPRTRADAKAAGLPAYLTGKPCLRGHISERRTVNGSCSECESVTLKAWERQNRGRRNARQQERRIERGGEVTLIHKAWRDANRERVRETDRVRGARHKEKVHARALEWQRENPDKVRARDARRRARVLNAGTYTPEDVAVLMAEQDGKCAYCKVAVGRDYHVDHKIPLYLGGMNTADNIQICRPTCNARKGHSDLVAFAARFKAEFVNANC